MAVVERVTGGVKMINTDHAAIHEGMAFTVSNKMDVASAQVGGLEITVPAGAYCHFKPASFSVSAGPIIVAFLEDYTFVGGSAIPSANRKRTSAATATVTVKGLANISAVAGAAPLNLQTILLSGNTTAGRLGAAQSLADEWVLKEGKYLIAITNATNPGATATVAYDLFWYEEGGA